MPNTVQPHVRQILTPDSATLVRGHDRYANFDLEPAPCANLDEAALAANRGAADRSAKAHYHDTDRTQFRA